MDMIMIEFLKTVVDALNRNQITYALAGGMAASLYRSETRATKDLDFLFFIEGTSEEKAQELLQRLGLSALLVRRADLEGGPMHAIKRKSTEVMIVVGRKEGNKEALGVDFILPTMPWAQNALKRAQGNLIEYAGVLVPTITAEDLILAKLYAIKNSSRRLIDVDDLRSIFAANHPLDYDYLASEMRRLDYVLPKALVEDAPEKLRVMFGRGKMTKEEK